VSIQIVGFAKIKTTSITLSATKVSACVGTMRPPGVVIWFEGPLLTPSIIRRLHLCGVMLFPSTSDTPHVPPADHAAPQMSVVILGLE